MKKILWVLAVLIFLFFNSCTEHPTEVLDTSKTQSTLSKESKYVPGTDITAQLKNDLDAGLDIKLPTGHFYVSETIIVQGYSGTVKGVGKDETIIEAAQGYKATEDPMFWPGVKLTEMFAVEWSKGDVTFKDFTILVTGDSPAEVHNNPFFGDVTTIDNAIVVAGVHEEAESGITVTFMNLRIKGESSSDPMSLNGKNLALPLIATGFLGAPKPVNTIIKNCDLENSGFTAIEYWDVFGGSGLMKNNKITNCFNGIAMLSWTDPLTILGEVTIKDNEFMNITNYTISNSTTWSSYCVKNNTLDGVLLPDDCQ